MFFCLFTCLLFGIFFSILFSLHFPRIEENDDFIMCIITFSYQKLPPLYNHCFIFRLLFLITVMFLCLLSIFTHFFSSLQAESKRKRREKKIRKIKTEQLSDCIINFLLFSDRAGRAKAWGKIKYYVLFDLIQVHSENRNFIFMFNRIHVVRTECLPWLYVRVCMCLYVQVSKCLLFRKRKRMIFHNWYLN